MASHGKFFAVLALDGEGFIQAAYQLLLKREVDQGGLNYYLGKMKAGASKLQVLLELSSSSEFQRSGSTVGDLQEILEAYRFLRRYLLLKPWKEKLNQLVRQLELQLESLHCESSRQIQTFQVAFEQQRQLQAFGAVGMDIELVRRSGLFDPEYYRPLCPELHSPEVLLEHFCTTGWREGKNPNAYFDMAWYLRKYPGVTGNPLVHYIVYGIPARFEVGPQFSVRQYLARYADVSLAGLDPLHHFLAFGRAEGRLAFEASLDTVRQDAPEVLKPFFEVQQPYADWIKINRLSSRAREELFGRLAKQEGHLPRISILMPVYNTPRALLMEAILSVKGQIHGDWELCIANDASPSPHVRPLLDSLQALDARIRVVHLEKNVGISGATNAAGALACGEVILFLDHDDLLTEDCLAEVALYYAENPQADLVYSDDDKIDRSGKRHSPQFKPDWSPALLLSYMYMGHVLTVRRSLFNELGGFDRRYDGSQDYEFALRASEKARHVGHIPRILYHWRVVPGSTAASGDAKPASMEAGRKGVQAALERRGIDAKAIHPAWAKQTKVGMFALSFPDQGPTVSLVIPTFNGLDLLRTCVESLKKTRYRNYEVLIVDNGSDDPATCKYLAGLKNRRNHRVVCLLNEGGFNYADLMNRAVAQVQSEYVLFLNNDTEVISPEWLSSMMGYAQMEGVGSVGACLRYGDGTIQHAGVVHGYHGGLAGHAFKGAGPGDWGYLGYIRASRNYSAVTAACMVTPRKLFLELGGFDAQNFGVAYNDADYGYRLVDRGYFNVYCPDAQLHHFEGKTRGFIDNPREVENYRKFHGGRCDKFLNPSLTLDDEQFGLTLRCVPRTRIGAPLRLVAYTHNLNYEGAPLVLFDVLDGLQASGEFQVELMSPCDGPLGALYKKRGIKIHLVPDIQAGVKDVEVFRHGLNIIKEEIQALESDVVMSNTLSGFWMINAAQLAGLPAIWCQHESEPWQECFNYLALPLRPYAYAAFAQAYRVTFVAEATRKLRIPLQTRQNYEVIRHGVRFDALECHSEPAARQALRKSLGLRDDELVVTLVGTLCARKNQEDLIRAVEKLPPVLVGQCRFLLVGSKADAAYSARIEQMLADLPETLRSRFLVPGSIPGAEKLYAISDVALCTSLVESAPRILMEAMYFALPIITTPVFGIPEMVKNDFNARFYEPGDARALAEALQTLIQDAPLRKKMGQNSVAVLRSLPGYADMVRAYRNLVHEASFASVV